MTVNSASKAAEQNRQEQQERADEADAVRVAADDNGADDGGVERGDDARQQEAERRDLRAATHHDDRRAKIASNFRRDRSEEAAQSDDNDREINEFIKAGAPPEMVDGDGAVEPEAAEPVQQAEPAKRKLVIRGEEKWYTEDEIVAMAQKTAAADDYLNEAREALREAKAARSEAISSRAASPHQTDDRRETEQDDDQSTGDQNTTDPAEALINDIQFGDPKEAGRKLMEFVQQNAGRAAKTMSAQERREAEHDRSMSYLRSFTEANPDLRDDKFASAAITQALIDMQAEDLLKAGIDVSKFQGTPAQVSSQVSNAHLILRSKERPEVRLIPDLLEGAKTSLENWRNGTKPSAAADTAPRAQPGTQQRAQQPASAVARDGRVEVNVDRTARRQAITPNPQRTVAPKPDAVASVPADQDSRRSSVVSAMKAERAQRRGQTAIH